MSAFNEAVNRILDSEDADAIQALTLFSSFAPLEIRQMFDPEQLVRMREFLRDYDYRYYSVVIEPRDNQHAGGGPLEEPLGTLSRVVHALFERAKSI